MLQVLLCYFVPSFLCSLFIFLGFTWMFLLAGCPKELQVQRLICDPLLLVEIEEMRTMSKGAAQPGVIEDFTG